MEKLLQAGFAKINMTPDYPIGLAGYGGDATRLWEKIEEEIYSTCIAVRNETETLLIYTADILAFRVSLQERFRAAVSRETGVPEDHIFFGAIHSHNTPSPWFKIFLDRWEEILIRAAKEALSDLAPASLFAGKKEIVGMNFTRHYITDKGVRHSANTGIPKDAVLVGHSTLSDPDLTVLCLKRDGKKDIVLVNWQAHCDSASDIGFTSICPSWAGRLRSKLEEKTGCLAAYFTGTSGNQAQSSKIESEKHHLKWFEYGEKMGEYAAEVLAECMEPVEGTRIAAKRIRMDAEPNHSDAHLYDHAMEAIRIRTEEKDPEKATAYCKAHGIYSIGHAKGIRARQENKTPPFLELSAFCIGDLGVVVNTNETFSDQGLFVKEHTPFKHSFIITGNSGYLACRESYKYYAYEALGWSGFFVEGTAEKMADAWVALLGDIKSM